MTIAIQSLVFVGTVTLIVIVSLAIPTLSIAFPRRGQQPSGGIRQIPVSPYRVILLFAWMLLLILWFNGGKAVLPMDLGDLLQWQRTSHTPAIATTTPHRETLPPATAATTTPAAPEPTIAPEAPTSTAPSVSASVQSEEDRRPPSQRRRWPSGNPDDPII